MRRYEFVLVDAFTTTPHQGNPCAVLLDAAGLEPAAMQRIARELGLSETAFVVGSERADVGVRYFTPLREIPLAGHPTVATAHALVEAGRLAPNARVSFEMPAGVIPVDIETIGQSRRYTMEQPAPKFGALIDPLPVASALGLSPADLFGERPPQIVSTGAPFLLVGLRSRDALDRAHADRAALFAAFDETAFGVHLFARTDGETAFIARQFGAPGDVAEDPVTGSACGALAAYAWQNRLVDEPAFTIAQGAHVGRPGRVYAQVLTHGGSITGVRVGGEAVSALRGAIAA